MRRTILTMMLLLSAILLKAQDLKSPDGNLNLHFSLTDNGKPTYSLEYKGKTVVKPSHLGLDIYDDKFGLASGFELSDSKTAEIGRAHV